MKIGEKILNTSENYDYIISQILFILMVGAAITLVVIDPVFFTPFKNREIQVGREKARQDFYNKIGYEEEMKKLQQMEIEK